MLIHIFITHSIVNKAKGRGVTKLEMRRNLIQWMKENKEIDTDNFLNYIQLPKVQAGLKMYIEYLKQKQH